MKSLKKFLSVLCAAAMLMSMMATIALAADTTVATYENTTSIEFSPAVTWNKGKSATGKYATVTNMADTYFILTPYNEDLTAGIYEIFHTPRSQGGNCINEIKYDFFGRATSSTDTTEVLDTVIAGGSLAMDSGNVSNFVGLYSFNGTEEETIKVGAPNIPNSAASAKDLRIVNLIFHPVTEKNVTKKYTVTKGETLTMPIMPELLGETKDVLWIDNCDTTEGALRSEGGVFTYDSANVEAEKDTFSFTGTHGSCTITVNVEVDIVDDNAVYFDDAQVAATETVRTVYGSGFNGKRKAFGDGASFKWNIAGIDAGVYDTYFYKTGEDGFDDVQSVTVSHNGEEVATSVSGLANGKEGWVKIGTFDFAGDDSEYIETSRKNTSDYYFATADAIKLVPVGTTVERKINLFAGQTYKESALLTFADADSEYLPEVISGDATPEGNYVVYTADTEGDYSFVVNCGDYTINYTVNVSPAPETIVAGITSVTTTGTWSNDAYVKSYDGETVSQKTYTLGDKVTWNIPSGISAGNYKLQIWKHNMAAEANTEAYNADYKVTDVAQLDIVHNGEQESFLQRGLSYLGAKTLDESSWLTVGTYFFNGNGSESITMTDIDAKLANRGYLYFGGFRLVPVTTATTSVGTYKEDYRSITSALVADTNLTSKFNVSNDAQGKVANVIKAIYNNGELESVDFLEKVYIEPYSNEEIHHVFTAPEAGTEDDYKVAIYLWDIDSGLVPVTSDIVLN